MTTSWLLWTNSFRNHPKRANVGSITYFTLKKIIQKKTKINSFGSLCLGLDYGLLCITAILFILPRVALWTWKYVCYVYFIGIIQLQFIAYCISIVIVITRLDCLNLILSEFFFFRISSCNRTKFKKKWYLCGLYIQIHFQKFTYKYRYT